MNLLRMNVILMALLLMSWPLLTFAQDNAGSTQLSTGATIPVGPSTATVIRNKSEKKQTLNFEDELVEGSAQKPELFYLFQKKNVNYKRLIKLRENFLPEMRRTSEDIQRLRGGR
ncbi:MAG: hypothetical protein H7256_14140 [Bdellovibrio sp.]|nr:hypothetical protein [Bdellovibrio sp.]